MTDMDLEAESCFQECMGKCSPITIIIIIIMCFLKHFLDLLTEINCWGILFLRKKIKTQAIEFEGFIDVKLDTAQSPAILT